MKPTVSVSSSAAAAEPHRARRRVERVEEPVLDADVGAGERVEQRRLARVRVAGERDRGRPARSRSARIVSREPSTSLELALERGDAVAREPAVGLDLRLARSARADAAAEPLEVRPQAAHAREVVLELRELDLQLALGAVRVPGEDVEDHARTVDDGQPLVWFYIFLKSFSNSFIKKYAN